MSRLNCKKLLKGLKTNYTTTKLKMNEVPSERTKKLLEKEFLTRNASTNKGKLEITSHALQRFNDRIELNSGIGTEKKIKELALTVKNKGVLLTNKYIVEKVFADEPKVRDYIIQKDWLSQSGQSIFYNDSIWMFKGEKDRTLVTVMVLPEELRSEN